MQMARCRFCPGQSPRFSRQKRRWRHLRLLAFRLRPRPYRERTRLSSPRLLLLLANGGGSWWYTPDRPPATPNAKSDEFSSAATLPGGGSAIWSWLNQGAATIGIVNDACQIVAPASSSGGLRCIYQFLPTGNYTITAKITWVPTATNYVGFANCKAHIFLRDSVGGKIISFGIGYTTQQQLQIVEWTNFTTFFNNVLGANTALNTILLRIVDDGTNLSFYYSEPWDGSNWIRVGQIGRTSYLTADSFGIFADPENASNPMTTNCHWIRVS